MFSTFTARAGRLGTAPVLRRTPVSGHLGGGGGVVGPEEGEPPGVPIACDGLPRPARADSPNTAAPMISRMRMIEAILPPRLVNAMSGIPRCGRRAPGPAVGCYRAVEPATTIS